MSAEHDLHVLVSVLTLSSFVLPLVGGYVNVVSAFVVYFMSCTVMYTVQLVLSCRGRVDD